MPPKRPRAAERSPWRWPAPQLRPGEGGGPTLQQPCATYSFGPPPLFLSRGSLLHFSNSKVTLPMAPFLIFGAKSQAMQIIYIANRKVLFSFGFRQIPYLPPRRKLYVYRQIGKGSKDSNFSIFTFFFHFLGVWIYLINIHLHNISKCNICQPQISV